MSNANYFFDCQCIKKWSSIIFTKVGLTSEDANILSDSLVLTSLWGIDSHGIARIPHYLKRISLGSINISPNINFVQTSNSVGQLHGDNGHGIIIMHKATKYAINLASNSGVGIVGVSNSSHCGAIGLYTRKITENNMIGIAFTHSDALVVPYGGKQSFFGTNPISIAVPTDKVNEPICLDMATSVIPWNFVMNARRENTLISPEYGVDVNGNAITDPNNIVALNSLAGYKGFGLAFLIDLLCGPLNGMQFGPHITPMYEKLYETRNLGSLIIAIDIKRFYGGGALKIISRRVINELKKQSEKIMYPGEPEYINFKERTNKGIPISISLLSEFEELSKSLQVDFEFKKK